MFHSPLVSKMVNTRSMVRKEQNKDRATTSSADGVPTNLIPRELFKTPFGSTSDVLNEIKTEENAPEVQSENDKVGISVPTDTQSSKPAESRKSKRSSSSSAIKKKLELEAAKEKARIQMELIDKQLAVEIAAIDGKYSSQPSSESDHHSKEKEIDKWLEQSHQELEKQKANAQDNPHSSMLPPPEAVGTSGPVQELARALQQMITTTVSNTQPNENTNLLSRISTPRDLPIFFGDPMEWLAFKQAYEESTSLCNFSEKENLWRLRKCLRGAAKDAVSALLISATSPTEIMSTLELQFGNPDIILSRIMMDIKKLSPLPNEYYKEIVPFSIKIKNYVAAVRALKRDEYLQGVNVANIVLSKLPTVLLTKWTDYSVPIITYEQSSRLDILSNFLNLEARKVSTCMPSLMNTRVDNRRRYSDNDYTDKTQAVLLQSAKTETKNSAKEKCRFCRVSAHKLTDCKKFKKALRKDRWAYVKRAGICYKCLLSRHDKNTCPAAPCDVTSCGLPHHRLLHYVPTERPSIMSPPEAENATNSENNEHEPHTSAENEVVTHVNSISCSTLLQVTMVNIHGPNGVISAPALLDGGSTISMISSSLAARVGLHGRKQTLRVRGAWDNTELVCEAELVDLTLSNKHGEQYTISARSVNRLEIPTQNFNMVNLENYPYLQKVKHELICNGTVKPEVLIGQDNRHLLKPIQTLEMEGDLDSPCATLTPLGWCLHGRVPRPHPRHHNDNENVTTMFISEIPTEQDLELRDLHESVRRSFAIDSMGVSTSKPRQNVEDQRALDYLEQTSELVDGKWHVGLPWKDANCVMPDTRPMALMRLKGVENKMKKDSKYAQRFIERIQHLLENDSHMECERDRKWSGKSAVALAPATNGSCYESATDRSRRRPPAMSSAYATATSERYLTQDKLL
ncbi:hypothetical protein NE865_13717 [Phthorimaea operculella]|nr:hypothetical protein NE865_13717 [Phthorimaea operculella]